MLSRPNNHHAAFKAYRITMDPRNDRNERIGLPAICTFCATLTYSTQVHNVDHFKINVTMPYPDDVATIHAFSWT